MASMTVLRARESATVQLARLFNKFDSKASPENLKIEAYNSKLAAEMAEKMILELP